MKHLVIFDLDGTLLNTIDDLAVSTNHALSACGYPQHPVAAYPFFVGNGIDKLLERALPPEAQNAAEVARMRAEFLPYYDKHNAVYTRPYAGITALLQQIQDAGIGLAVASNKYQSATLQLIEKYFPDIKFTATLGQREGVPKKPHPMIVEEIIAAAQCTVQEVLYVGDSGVDMATARNAGVESVGVTWGFRPEAELREAGACHIVHEASEIWQYIEQ